MVDCRAWAGKEVIAKISCTRQLETAQRMSKRHRNQQERATTRQIWDNLNTEKSNSKRL